jgi:signal transduction histidine kinase
VADHGKGFTPPALNPQDESSYSAHIGLLGMQERVALVGGHFHLSSQPGQGTTIIVKVPVDE